MEDNENQGEAKHAEEFEVDPDVAAEVAHDIKVGRTHACKKEDPAKIEASPYRLGQLEIGTEHPLDGGLLAEEVAGQERRAEQPVDDGRFPFDELLVVEIQGQATEDDDDRQGDQLHLFHRAGLEPGDADLQESGGNGDPGSDIDVEKFVGYEKEQNRKKI